MVLNPILSLHFLRRLGEKQLQLTGRGRRRAAGGGNRGSLVLQLAKLKYSIIIGAAKALPL